MSHDWGGTHQTGGEGGVRLSQVQRAHADQVGDLCRRLPSCLCLLGVGGQQQVLSCRSDRRVHVQAFVQAGRPKKVKYHKFPNLKIIFQDQIQQENRRRLIKVIFVSCFATTDLNPCLWRPKACWYRDLNPTCLLLLADKTWNPWPGPTKQDVSQASGGRKPITGSLTNTALHKHSQLQENSKWRFQ